MPSFNGVLEAFKLIPTAIAKLPAEDKYPGLLVLLLAVIALAIGMRLPDDLDRTLGIVVPLSGLIIMIFCWFALQLQKGRRRRASTKVHPTNDFEDKLKKTLEGW